MYHLKCIELLYMSKDILYVTENQFCYVVV